MTTVGIVGAGPIGQGLAQLWGGAGRQVTLGARSRRPGGALPGVSLGSFEDAASRDVVVLAVPGAVAEAVVARLASRLAGKPVLSVMNMLELRDGVPVSALPGEVSEGSWLARLLPDSVVVRAFTHIQDELLVSRARRQPGLWAVAFAMDDDASRPEIQTLLADTGYVPVFVGDLAGSAVLDAGGPFFPRMLTGSQAERMATACRLPRMLARFNDATIGEVLADDVRWRFPYAPSLGLVEIVEGREAVVAHLCRVRDSGVRIGDVWVEQVTVDGAVAHATGSFPTANGASTCHIVSVVKVGDGVIREAWEYWDTAVLGQSA